MPLISSRAVGAVSCGGWLPEGGGGCAKGLTAALHRGGVVTGPGGGSATIGSRVRPAETAWRCRSSQWAHRTVIADPCCAVREASRGGDHVQRFRPEVAGRLTELAPLLLDQLDAMTDRMIEVLLRTEPAYRDVLAHREEEMRESTRGNLEQGLHLLSGPASGNVRTSLREARDGGRRRAAEGIPLEAV